MILGGYADSGTNRLSTLFNWSTLKICSLPTLPYKVSGLVATAGFGLPMFCGGNDPESGFSRKTCFKFNLTTKGWTQVSVLFLIYFKFKPRDHKRSLTYLKL
jgi:hypothetical protein